MSDGENTQHIRGPPGCPSAKRRLLDWLPAAPSASQEREDAPKRASNSGAEATGDTPHQAKVSSRKRASNSGAEATGDTPHQAKVPSRKRASNSGAEATGDTPHLVKVSSRAMQLAMAVSTSPGGRIYVDPNNQTMIQKTPRGCNIKVARTTETKHFWCKRESKALQQENKRREMLFATGEMPGMPSILTSIRRASTTGRESLRQDDAGGRLMVDSWLDLQATSTVGENVEVPQDSEWPSPLSTVVPESRADSDLQDQVGTSSASLPAPVIVPLQNDPGSDVDDFEESDHIFILPRTVNTALSLALPSPEQDPLAETVLNNIAASQDAADEVTLTETNDTYEWTSDYSTYRGRQEVFTVDAPGPTIPDVTPYGNFCNIWDENIMRHIAEMTNLYAEQKAAGLVDNDKLTVGARINDWVPTDTDELYVYFAILMYMAIDQRGSIKEYWITDPTLEMTGFRRLMTYNRFILLNSMLHFIDNTSDLPADLDRKVAKLQPIIDHCNQKFQSCYILDQNIAIDESLTLWKGHLSWVQNIMSKAARFGIKTFELCESSTGYLWKFIIYTGKTCNVGEIGQTSNTLVGKTSAIVLNLMHDLTHKGYCLTMDNFYNSPALARHLKSVGTDCVGTLRIARKNVPETIKRLNKKNMDRGDMVAEHCGDISIVAWNDAKLVVTISTFHNADTYLGRRGGRPQTKPVIIKDYNSAMGGVDLKDQKLSMYLMERKRGLKWYIKMFKRLLNASILNSFIMYRRTLMSAGRVSLSHRDFRYALAAELVRRHSTALNIERPLLARPDRYDGVEHYLFPIKILCARCSVTVERGCTDCKPKRRRCVTCTTHGQRKMTWDECKKCAKALCTGECFVEYHTLQDK